MRTQPLQKVEPGRMVMGAWASDAHERNGAFVVKGPCGMWLKIIASEGDAEIPWEHVSVSLQNRNPNWDEMCWVKNIFWSADECVIQYHPRASEYVNMHPHCLHLWKPIGIALPEPPSIAVGWKTAEAV